MNSNGQSEDRLTEIVPVSVIIPCFNCTRTIKRAVESVAQQTSRPAELILVDDASCDDTFNLLTEMQNSYGMDWIKVVRLAENAGPSAARNRGWDEATQFYLAFLDADDAWHPRKLQLQYEWMKNHPEVRLTGHGSLVINQDLEVSFTLPEEIRAHRIKPVQLLVSNRFPTTTVMLHRELPQRFESSMRYAEDYYLWLQVVLKGFPVSFLDLPVAYSFKARFGETGLSSDLWEMERGELKAYLGLHKAQLISGLPTLGLLALSLSKFLVRLIKVKTASLLPGKD